MPIAIACANGDGDKSNPDEETQVTTIIAGIISYSSWPNIHGLPHLCLSTTARYQNSLRDRSTIHRDLPYIPITIMDIGENTLSQCDAIYFGNETPLQQKKVLQQHQSPLLLIAEQNNTCEIGSAFCLEFKHNSVTFSVNLDSLARCKVRVNPAVLLLAKPDKVKNE